MNIADITEKKSVKEKNTTPPHVAVMQIIHSKTICRCLSIAAEIGVADRLADSPKSASRLAEECNVKEEPLARVLRALIAAGVFAKTQDNLFANNALSETLISDRPATLRSFARWVGTHLHWDTMAHLDYSVTTGKSALIRDEPDGDPFDVMSRDKVFQDIFNEAMTGLSLVDGVVIVESYDFSSYRSVMDVGGGKGALAQFIADSAPNTEVIVYDLPHVIEETQKRIKHFSSRVKTRSGSFFKQVPGTVELIVMKHILHDWDDDHCLKILNNCRAALKSDGRILICEMLVNDTPEGIVPKLVDIDMLVGPGGKERTEEEFQRLLAQAGFELVKTLRTNSPINLIEAKLS